VLVVLLMLKCDISSGWHLQQAMPYTMAWPLQQSFVEYQKQTKLRSFSGAVNTSDYNVISVFTKLIMT